MNQTCKPCSYCLNLSTFVSAAEDSVKLFREAYSAFTSPEPFPYSLLLQCYNQLRVSAGLAFQFRAFLVSEDKYDDGKMFWQRVLSINTAVKDAALKMREASGYANFLNECVDYGDDLPF